MTSSCERSDKIKENEKIKRKSMIFKILPSLRESGKQGIWVMQKGKAPEQDV